MQIGVSEIKSYVSQGFIAIEGGRTIYSKILEPTGGWGVIPPTAGLQPLIKYKKVTKKQKRNLMQRVIRNIRMKGFDI